MGTKTYYKGYMKQDEDVGMLEVENVYKMICSLSLWLTYRVYELSRFDYSVKRGDDRAPCVFC